MNSQELEEFFNEVKKRDDKLINHRFNQKNIIRSIY